MSTPREIFLEMLKPDGRPERILDQYEALAMMTGDPINAYLRGVLRYSRALRRAGQVRQVRRHARLARRQARARERLPYTRV